MKFHGYTRKLKLHGGVCQRVRQEDSKSEAKPRIHTKALSREELRSARLAHTRPEAPSPHHEMKGTQSTGYIWQLEGQNGLMENI